MTMGNTSMSTGTVGVASKTDANNRTFAAIDKNQALIDGTPAAGRRVHLPWGGDTFDFSKLTNDGKTLMKRSVDWAAAP